MADSAVLGDGFERADWLRRQTGRRLLRRQIRQHFYKVTLPWSDEGYRLLPAHFYFELSARMREFEQSFSKQVDDFLDSYPSYIEHVRPELNGLFREEDYPSADVLRKKFGLKLEVLPIPSGDDFRVTMSAEEQARVAREIDANVRQSLEKGTEDLWNRQSVVSHMADRLNEPESRFWSERGRHHLAHVGLYGDGNPMNKPLSSVVRIQKTRTTLLLDHPFFGTLLFRAPARRSIATMAADGVS
jgi:hypothetical protein